MVLQEIKVAVKKNEATEETGNDPEGLFQKNKIVMEGFSEEVTFEQRLKVCAMYLGEKHPR